MEGSGLVFNHVNGLNYKSHKISLGHGGSYIDYPEWVKRNKGTVNLNNNNDDNCFQYAATVALNRENNGKHPERMEKITSLLNQLDWNEIISRQKQKTDKSLRKTTYQSLLMFCLQYTIKKKKTSVNLKTQLRAFKLNNSINGYIPSKSYLPCCGNLV